MEKEQLRKVSEIPSEQSNQELRFSRPDLSLIDWEIVLLFLSLVAELVHPMRPTI